MVAYGTSSSKAVLNHDENHRYDAHCWSEKVFFSPVPLE